MRVECFAATRPQQGRSDRDNEDAFLLSHDDPPFAVLCDGGGNAQRVAKKILQMFQRLCRETTSRMLAEDATWAAWIQSFDAALLKGPPSTFLGVVLLDGLAVGACVGDSRAYLVDRAGECRLLTEGAGKQQLGTCKAVAFPIRHPLKPGETLLLLSDGAWAHLSPDRLIQAVSTAPSHLFSEVPRAILDAASRHGCLDDMTAIAIRLAP